jgi:hypothetical protein
MSKKDKILYWALRLLGIFISGCLPISAVIEHFPLWIEHKGAGRTIWVGTLLILIIVAVIFRKTVINYIRERFKTRTYPPVMGWVAMLCIAYVLRFINDFIMDMTSIFWMGLIGGLLGSLCLWFADRIKKKKGGTES